MSSLYINQDTNHLNPNATERYYLEHGMCSSDRLDINSTNYSRRASSPSETSGSDRYIIDRGPASLATISNFRTVPYNRNQPSTSVDAFARFDRFSPSQDQGYATLVSPSPSNQMPTPWNKKGICRSGPVFDLLSDDVVLKIFSWLDSSDLCSITRVCHRFESLVWKPVLWKCCSQITTVNLNPVFDPPRRLLLQYLDLTDCCSINDEGLKIIVVNCPQLVFLYLRRCVQITDAGLKFVPSFCIALRELSVSDCCNITDFGIYELAKLGAALRYLSVAKCDQVSDAGLKVIARRCYKLRYLNARGCEAVSDDSITVLANSCPRLRALDIGKCDVSDAVLRALAEQCPILKKFSLKNCDMISDRGIQYIAYYCRGLQQLNIQDCQVSLEGYRAVKRFCKRCVIEHTNHGFF